MSDMLELTLGAPAHGGFCVARADGRVVFVRGGLPGERVLGRVTEDRGGSFCRAEVAEVLDASPDRVPVRCPDAVAGAGCCDLSHVAVPAQRAWKAAVVAEQLRRIARLDRPVEVAELPGTGDGGGWRTRVRLAVDAAGRAGAHGYRSGELVTGLACVQPVPGLLDGLDRQTWLPGAELVVAGADDGSRQVVELAAARVSRTGRSSAGRRGASARRAAAERPRHERVAEGTGRVLERVGTRAWEVGVAGFWQAHRGAAQVYSDLIAEWTATDAAVALDLYSGAGVFAARLAERAETVFAVESARRSVQDGRVALADLPQVRFLPGRVERRLAELPDPGIVVLDPPRSGAGKQVAAAVTARRPDRIVHVGCDPAAFARDVAAYRSGGYELAELRAFDAFPMTHHVEVIGLFARA